MIETRKVEWTRADHQMNQTDLKDTIEKIQELHGQVTDEQITRKDSTALTTCSTNQLPVVAIEQTRVENDQLIFAGLRRRFAFVKRRHIVDLTGRFEEHSNVVSTAGQSQRPSELRHVEQQGLNAEYPGLPSEENQMTIISASKTTYQPLIVDNERFISFISGVRHTHVVRNEIGIVRIAIRRDCFIIFF